MSKLPRILQWGTPKPAYYQGILMRANPGLHEESFDVIRKFCDAGDNIVDVGAGQGAFSARLKDAGFSVTAVDKNPDDFRARDVRYLSVNFDSGSDVASFVDANRDSFDVAIGMEVIEHVESPWDYFRLLLSLVRPGGIVLLTTPNVASCHSRINFLFTGLFDHFSLHDLRESGHINPLTAHELRIIAEGTGAEVISLQTLCRQPWLIASRNPGTILKSLLSAMLRPFMKAQADGDILCAVLRKPASVAQNSST